MAPPKTPARAVRALRARRNHAHGLRDHALEVARGSGLEPDTALRPVFIIGAPRSGSTLLYQLMTEHFDVGYLSNAHCAHHWDPSGFEQRERPLAARSSSDFTSAHGATRESWGPSECGEYWYRFVERTPHRIAPDDVSDIAVNELRASVRALVAAFGQPVVYKNLLCSLRLPLIARALPEALFIVIERDELANGRSLLAGRIDRFGDADTWWSAEPPTIESLRKLPAERQVVGQIRDLLGCVREDASRIGADRFHTVHYEALCERTARELARIAAFAHTHGMQLTSRDAAHVPAAFAVSDGGAALPPEIEARLQAAVVSRSFR